MALYHLLDYQTGFESVGFSVQEKKFNLDIQDGGYIGFTTVLALREVWESETPINCPETSKN